MGITLPAPSPKLTVVASSLESPSPPSSVGKVPTALGDPHAPMTDVATVTELTAPTTQDLFGITTSGVDSR
jgi:hypothetical protein